MARRIQNSLPKRDFVPFRKFVGVRRLFEHKPLVRAKGIIVGSPFSQSSLNFAHETIPIHKKKKSNNDCSGGSAADVLLWVWHPIWNSVFPSSTLTYNWIYFRLSSVTVFRWSAWKFTFRAKRTSTLKIFFRSVAVQTIHLQSFSSFNESIWSLRAFT